MKPLLLLATLLLAGCASTGAFYHANLTQVELSEGNYHIVASGVTGEAWAGYLIGLSAGTGPQLSTLGLVRIKGTGRLYQEALDALWADFETKHGAVEGRSLALVNVRYDTDALNVLGLYTEPRVFVRADVVEFDDGTPGG